MLHHHERWDGGGYPIGLARTEIPLEARVLTVADAFDAMTSLRPYRAALQHAAAVEELDRCAGSHFDPLIVGAFVEAWHGELGGDPRSALRAVASPARGMRL